MGVVEKLNYKVFVMFWCDFRYWINVFVVKVIFKGVKGLGCWGMVFFGFVYFCIYWRIFLVIIKLYWNWWRFEMLVYWSIEILNGKV